MKITASEFVFDVPELGLDGPSQLAATVHRPLLERDAPRGVLVRWVGGGYSRAYWDMTIPGRVGYSFAEHLADHGFVVVSVDHLGVGRAASRLTETGSISRRWASPRPPS